VTAGRAGTGPASAACSRRPGGRSADRAPACLPRREVSSIRGRQRLRAEDIDRDPTGLAPGGALGIVAFWTPPRCSARHRAVLLELARRHALFPRGAGFAPRAHLTRLLVGIYSSRAPTSPGSPREFEPGGHRAGGRRDPDHAPRIPVVRTVSSERSLYTADNAGSCPQATPSCFGNETGILRVLDRSPGGPQAGYSCLAEDLVVRQTRRWPWLRPRAEHGVVACGSSSRSPVGSAGALVGNFAPPVNTPGRDRGLRGRERRRPRPAVDEIQGLVQRWGGSPRFGDPQPPPHVRSSRRPGGHFGSGSTGGGRQDARPAQRDRERVAPRLIDAASARVKPATRPLVGRSPTHDKSICHRAQTPRRACRRRASSSGSLR
jgi:hypothetical protein